VTDAVARWGAQAVESVPVLNRQAERYRQLGRFAEARPLYQRAIDILAGQGASSQQDLATLYGNLGVLERQDGQHTQAEALLRKALALRGQAFPPGHRRRAPLEASLGTLLLTQARYPEAQEYLDAALHALEPAPPTDPQGLDEYLSVLNNLAALQRATGDYRQAELSLSRALTLARQDRQTLPTTRIALLNALGDLDLLLGDSEGAEAPLREAIQTARTVSIPAPLLAATLNNLSQLRQRQHRFPEARTCQENSLNLLLAQYGPNHPDSLLSQYNLGMLLYRTGDLANAGARLREVLARREQAEPDSLAVADTLNALAGVAWAEGRDDETQRLLTQALTIRTKRLPSHHPDLAISQTNLAIFQGGSGHYQASLDAFAQANAIDADLLEQVLGFAREEQKLKYLTEKSGHLHALFSLVTAQLAKDGAAVRLAADAWLRRKGLLLEAQRRYREALVYRDAPQAVALLQRLGRLRGELSELIYSAKAETPLAERRRAMAQLEAAIASLERELTQVSPSYVEERTLTQADVPSIVARLPPHSVLVELARFDRFAFAERDPRRRWGAPEYLAFLIGPDLPGGVVLVPLGPAAHIEQTLLDLLSRLDGEPLNAQAVARYSLDLYQTLFRPIEQRFPQGTREVMLAPDGQLNLLPFDILRTEQGRFLTQQYQFSYLATGRDLLRRRQATTATGTAFLLGDPNFDLGVEQQQVALRRLGILDPRSVTPDRSSRFLGRSHSVFQRLQETRREVESIRQILGPDKTQLYLGNEALEDLFDALPHPRLVHLATHGFFLPDLVLPPAVGESRAGVIVDDPLLRAGLALAGANRGLHGSAAGHDGVLTAEEVLGLDLRGTELVVLSACQTGLGKVVNGEGVYGLRRAFSAAGAQGLVMSLWSVADQETQELMVALYQGLVQQGLPPGQALQQARNKMIPVVQERYGDPSPYYWGAFIYQGLPTALGK